MKVELWYITWESVCVRVDCELKHIPWDALRAATKQEDAALAKVYGWILQDALEHARRRKSLRIVVRNVNGHDSDTAAYTWAAELYTMGGEFVSGRFLGMEWGQTGSRRLAVYDAQYAKDKLTEMGYEVRTW